VRGDRLLLVVSLLLRPPASGADADAGADGASQKKRKRDDRRAAKETARAAMDAEKEAARAAKAAAKAAEKAARKEARKEAARAAKRKADENGAWHASVEDPPLLRYSVMSCGAQLDFLSARTGSHQIRVRGDRPRVFFLLLHPPAAGGVADAGA
jgi:hypothetical protein